MPATRDAGRRMPRVALFAVMWCCAFAALHMFWALGGSAGLASAAGTDLAVRRSVAFVMFGLWGVAIGLVLAAVLIVAVGTGRCRCRATRVGAWAIAVIGVGLLVRGVVLEVLLATNAGEIRAAVGPLETRWSLILWNPWFMLDAALFIGSARQLVGRPRPGSR